MTLVITNPVNISLQDWSDQLLTDLSVHGSFGPLSGDDWQNWAMQFLNVSTLPGEVPYPYQFKDWRQWATRLCQTIG